MAGRFYSHPELVRHPLAPCSSPRGCKCACPSQIMPPILKANQGRSHLLLLPPGPPQKAQLPATSPGGATETPGTWSERGEKGRGVAGLRRQGRRAFSARVAWPTCFQVSLDYIAGEGGEICPPRGDASAPPGTSPLPCDGQIRRRRYRLGLYSAAGQGPLCATCDALHNSPLPSSVEALNACTGLKTPLTPAT